MMGSSLPSGGVLDAGPELQTAKHARTTVSAIFTHAKRLGWHTGDNPAKLVRLPEMIRKESSALGLIHLATFRRKIRNGLAALMRIVLPRMPGSPPYRFFQMP
jgi:hypothetical protein